MAGVCAELASSLQYRRAQSAQIPHTSFSFWSKSSCRSAANTSARSSPLLRATVAEDSIAVLDAPDTEDWDAQFGSQGPLPYGVSAQQGPRETMEDFVTVVPKGRCGFLYAGVFDGHQGPNAAAFLSERLYGAVSDFIQEAAAEEEGPAGKVGRAALTILPGGAAEKHEDTGLYCPVQLQSILEKSFQRMDREVLDWLHGQELREDRLAGSTATVLLVRRDRLVVANVGDSRAILARNGEAIHLSSEHRVSGEGEGVQAEIERVESVGGWISDGRVCDILAVSRAFGDTEFKGEGLGDMIVAGVESEFWTQEFADSISFSGDPVVALPDVNELSHDEGDEFIVLATDGLWDVMSSHDVVSLARREFRRGRNAQQIADMLTTTALRKHTVDNVSAVVVDLGGGKEGWPPPGKRKGKNLLRLFMQ